VVLMEDSDETDAARVADRIVEELGRPSTLQGHDIVVRASIGICISQGSDTAADLLRNADLAMYASKSRGNGLFEFFGPTMHIHAVERLELEAELRRAVRQQKFTLNYQPIVDLRTERPVGMRRSYAGSIRRADSFSPPTFSRSPNRPG